MGGAKAAGCLYHVGLRSELVRLQTLQRHPFDRQLDAALVVDAVVLFVVDVSGQAKIGYFDRVALIQPVGDKQGKVLVPIQLINRFVLLSKPEESEPEARRCTTMCLLM